MPRLPLALVLAAALGLATPAFAAPPPTVGALVDEQMMGVVRQDPELRTQLGISGDGIDLSGELTDVSLPRREALRAKVETSLGELARFDAATLTGQDRWSHGLAEWFYRRQLELMRPAWAPAWLPAGASTYAVDQLFSVPVVLPQFLQNQHAVRDEASARAYVSRLHAVAKKIDDVRANFDMQQAHGALPPQVAMEGAAAQIRALVAPAPAESPLVLSFKRRLDALKDLPATRRDALLAQAVEAVRVDANPAYARLLARLDEEIARQPGDHGMWALPDGDAFYDASLRWNTSTDLDAERIHAIGVAEVARIEAEMDARLRAQGLVDGSVGARMSALLTDPRFRYEDSDAGRAELLADARRRLDALQPHIPAYFSLRPAQPLEVRPVSKEAESGAPGAYYVQPAMDGSRPGVFFINLGQLEANTRWSLPTLTYHEGAPGHHFQIAIAQTLDELPMLRRSLNPSAFTEGWALYAEQLAAEMGLYRDDPWGDLGRLRAELFRSVRLVVDTGLHRKRWSTRQAIDYMRAHTGMPEIEVRSEVHRYLVQPGQACSYKIGHLKFVELRERARDALGEGFDIRAFHDLVLGNGAVPLAVLEASVEDWIARRREAGTVAAR
ncbi:MAG TPA: DUF885 domain-containing protein [Lysobacter sp.]|nr:DUF885 domain-containing protein [Lysobacter sp.]